VNKKKLKQFEKLLIAERDKLLQKLNFDKEIYGDLQKQDIGDIVDKAFNMWELDRTIDITENDKRLLKLINAAIERTKSGDYGNCSCGSEIAEKRLEAIPWTTKCVNCVKALQHR
jgi:DnaK suppressor protein